jgi:hypothetical protein
MKTALRVLILFVAVFGFTSSSHAAPITYTISGIASGQLGLSSFNNALVLVTVTADTDNVIVQGVDGDGDGINDVNFYANASSLTTVNIAGLGTVNVNDPTAIFGFPPIPPEFLEEGEDLLQLPTVIIGTVDHPPALDSFTGLAAVGGDPLLGYNLATSIGPINGAGGVGYPTGLFVNTTGGSLSFVSNVGLDTTGTFTATTVPEPMSLSLFGVGILSLAGLSRFRKRI